MMFEVGDIVLRRGFPSYYRRIVINTYKDRQSNGRMTLKDLRWGDVVSNCKMENFLPYPYCPPLAVVERVKRAVSPDNAFKIGTKKYLALPTRLVPELVVQHLIADGLLGQSETGQSVTLASALRQSGLLYRVYREQAKEEGRKAVNPSSYVYQVLGPLEKYQWRW